MKGKGMRGDNHLHRHLHLHSFLPEADGHGKWERGADHQSGVLLRQKNIIEICTWDEDESERVDETEWEIRINEGRDF